jgi:hypothetical protein
MKYRPSKTEKRGVALRAYVPIIVGILVLINWAPDAENDTKRTPTGLLGSAESSKPRRVDRSTRMTISWSKYSDGWRHYNWEFAMGRHRRDPVRVDLCAYVGRRAKYRQMQNRYVGMAHSHGKYNRYFRNDPYRHRVKRLARTIEKTAHRLGLNKIELALSFVQNLPYQHGMGSYQRYAFETLLDGAGDCSDKLCVVNNNWTPAPEN